MIKLTVYFDGQFWILIFERISKNKIEISKTVYGSEPKDYEIYDFILSKFYSLKFSNAIDTDINKEISIKNPKRMQRKISKQLKEKGISTKSQEALRISKEENKIITKKTSKEMKFLEKQIKFEKSKNRKKEKKKGH